MWQSPRAEGFVELEQDFARLLKKAGGKKWLCRTIVAEDGNIWVALRKEIPPFFSTPVQLNFISSDQCGVRSLDFPQEATEDEIKSNLQLKRKEFFNSREELLFGVKLKAARQDKNREVLVSYLPKNLLEEAESLCKDIGFTMGKLTTSADTIFGAFQRQAESPGQDACVLLQVGYSRVHLSAVRGQEILAVRSLLTGSLRELENLLFTGFSLPKVDVWMMLGGAKPITIPAVEDAIKTNRLELMTHIGSLFSELRSKKLLTEKSVFYISNSFVAEPELGSMISERFGVRVEMLTGIQDGEIVETPEETRAVWLSGSSLPSVANLVPAFSRRALHLALPVRAAVLAAVVMAAAPLPFLNLVKMRSAKELAIWKERHIPTQKLVDDFTKAAAEQLKLATLAKEITVDIDRRGLATRLTRYLTEKLPLFSRLEKIEVNFKENQILVTGYTVDAETALRYLDMVKAFAELIEPEITIGDLDSRRIKFDITALIGKKG